MFITDSWGTLDLTVVQHQAWHWKISSNKGCHRTNLFGVKYFSFSISLHNSTCVLYSIANGIVGCNLNHQPNSGIKQILNLKFENYFLFMVSVGNFFSYFHMERSNNRLVLSFSTQILNSVMPAVFDFWLVRSFSCTFLWRHCTKNTTGKPFWWRHSDVRLQFKVT